MLPGPAAANPLRCRSHYYPRVVYVQQKADPCYFPAAILPSKLSDTTSKVLRLAAFV